MASALAKTVSDPSTFSVKLSQTGTMTSHIGDSQFYHKRSIVNIDDCVEVEEESRRSSVKLKKLTVLQDGETRFPKLAECAHFHYEFVEFGKLNLTLDKDVELDALSEQWFIINVSCNAKNWTIRRTYESLYILDKQLHRCIYDRKFSMLPELTKDLVEEEGPVRALGKICAYLDRFSGLADSMINCGPILCWMEMDNRGKRLIVPDHDAAVNIPAIGAAHAVRRYIAQSVDEISFEVGDILSIIDKPPSHESTWWRGKKEFEVGYFPSDFVELIGTTKIPPSVAALASAPAKPVLHKKGKMSSFLVGFFYSRPNRTTLKQTGIVKERVFGCDLGEHLLNSGQDVPLVLKCCAEVLEKHGIVDGVYRLCGVASNLQKLRNEFDENHVPDLTTEMYIQDIHCISSLVKMYFRELPNPLLTYQLYDKFTSALNEASYEDKLSRLREVVRQLPPPHFRTAKFLFKHLSRMASYHSETSMHYKNLAIVWAPNLLRSKDLDQAPCVAALKGAGLQAVVTEFLISGVNEIFDETCQLNCEIEDGGSCSSLTRPKSIGLPSSGTKLLSLEEAQERALGSAAVKEQKYISVGEGPAALTSMYHTVIDLPKDRKKTVRRSVISNWRSLFSRTHSMTLPSSLGTQGRFSDITNSVSTNPRDGESIKRIKRTETLGDSDCANDLLDGKRRSISCDVIDSASLDLMTLNSSVSKSGSRKPDTISVDVDPTSFDTLRSLQSACVNDQLTLPVEKPFQTYPGRLSRTELEQPLRSPLPSFRKGSCVTSRPLSESSPTDSEKRFEPSEQCQVPSEASLSSFGSDKLVFDENHFKIPVSSKTVRLDSDYRDRSSSVDYCRQSLNSFKPEPCTETTTEKTNFPSQSSKSDSYSKPLAQAHLRENVEENNSLSCSDQTRQLLYDEQEFLSWKLSESTGSRDLLSELSPAISRVMPQNAYLSSVGDDSVFCLERTGSSDDMYESCQSLSVVIPVTCDIGSIPENIDKLVNVDENEDARFSSVRSDGSLSTRHSNEGFSPEKNRNCRENSQEHNFEADSFRSRQNESPSRSTVSFDASRLDETDLDSCVQSVPEHSVVSSSRAESHWKSSQISSFAEDKVSSAVNSDSEPVDNLDDDGSGSHFVEPQSTAASEEINERGNSIGGGGGDFDGLDISARRGSLESVENELKKECSKSSDRPLNIRGERSESVSTVESISSFKSNVSAEADMVMPVGSESPASASQDPGFVFEVSEVGQKPKRKGLGSNQANAYTRNPLSCRPPLLSRKTIQKTAKSKSVENSPSGAHQPPCQSLQKHQSLQEQPMSPSDDVFLSSVDDSSNSHRFEYASSQLTEPLPPDSLTDRPNRSETSSSPIFEEDKFSSSVSLSSSASSRSDLRSSVSRLPTTEQASNAFDQSESSALTFGSTTTADQQQRNPKVKRTTDPREPTSTSEFFSESESPSSARLESVKTPSSDSAVYAEILRARSRKSDPPPAVHVKPIAGAYVTRASAPFSSQKAKPGKPPDSTKFGSLKERKKIFEKAV